jgi:hypothetical protein
LGIGENTVEFRELWGKARKKPAPYTRTKHVFRNKWGFGVGMDNPHKSLKIHSTKQI